jgi:Raf kinase inhibitor-like YbhB/YbcL family protein
MGEIRFHRPMNGLFCPLTAAVAFVLICDDLEDGAEPGCHWVFYDVPATLGRLAESIPPVERPPVGGAHGRNGFGDYGYSGPCPPLLETHTYCFRLCALDTRLVVPPGADRLDVLTQMQGHVLAEAELLGRYGR